MPYVELPTIKKVLRDDYLIYPDDIDPYIDFAETEINGRLAGTYPIPFDEVTLYASVPPLIQWISAYLVGYKLYDEMTSLEDIEKSTGDKWWEMAQRWLLGLVEGDYLLHLADGTLVENSASTRPRSYPSGVRDKAPSTDNIPYFNRSQAGEW